MVEDKYGIIHTNNQEHKGLADAMKGFLDNGEPREDIFVYDVDNGSLFGVENADTSLSLVTSSGGG